MTITNAPGESRAQTSQSPVAHHHLCRFDRSGELFDRIMFASPFSCTHASNGGASAAVITPVPSSAPTPPAWAGLYKAGVITVLFLPLRTAR